MPFSNTGTYTAPAAATDATPGEVISSSDWNSIFTDIQNAMTEVGQQQWPTITSPQLNSTTAPYRQITSSGNITVNSTDLYILVQAQVNTITLPACVTKVSPVTIMGGATGFFASHNTTISPNGAETISGAASLVLNADFQVVTLWPLPSGGWVVTDNTQNTTNYALVAVNNTMAGNNTFSGTNTFSGNTTFASSQTTFGGLVVKIALCTSVAAGVGVAYTLVATDYFVSVDTSGNTGTNSTTIVLYSTPVTGQTVLIKDQGLSATTKNIVVNGNGKNIIGVASSTNYTMNFNGQSAAFTYNGTAWLAN